MAQKLFFSVFLFVFISFSSQGQGWLPVGDGIKNTDGTESKMIDHDGFETNGYVNALAVYKGELYAGGIFKIAGGKKVSNIARWNGKEWSAVGAGTNGKINALCVYNDALYIGGIFDTAGGKPANNIAKWNGEKWENLGVGTDSDVNALLVSKGELYVGGDFSAAGDIEVKNIAKWNGSAWSIVGTGVPLEVFSLSEYNGELYAGATLNVKGGEIANNVFKFNGKKFVGIAYFNGVVSALGVYKGKHYAGGHFGMVLDENVSFIAENSGKGWVAVGEGIGSHTAQHHVSAMLATDDLLIVGGRFKAYLNGKEANSIAKWDGTKWSLIGAGVNNAVYALTIYNGELYAAGSFSTAGDKPANGIAKWNLK